MSSGREGGREGGGGRGEGRRGGKEGGGREGGTEEGREGWREGGREGGREEDCQVHMYMDVQSCMYYRGDEIRELTDTRIVGPVWMAKIVVSTFTDSCSHIVS